MDFLARNNLLSQLEAKLPDPEPASGSAHTTHQIALQLYRSANEEIFPNVNHTIFTFIELCININMQKPCPRQQSQIRFCLLSHTQ
jgi:hypothetical protein